MSLHQGYYGYAALFIFKHFIKEVGNKVSPLPAVRICSSHLFTKKIHKHGQLFWGHTVFTSHGPRNQKLGADCAFCRLQSKSVDYVHINPLGIINGSTIDFYTNVKDFLALAAAKIIISKRYYVWRAIRGCPIHTVSDIGWRN